MKKTISQCMIVKNEEKNIRRALSWGKDIMCEQIVVDTGSSDRTVEIAREMGAKIFFFPWINDFAAAKILPLNPGKRRLDRLFLTRMKALLRRMQRRYRRYWNMWEKM